MDAAPLNAEKEDFVDRATAAFRRRLSTLVEDVGLPREEPEPLGERAGLVAAASSLWADHVGPFLDTQGVTKVLGGGSRHAISLRVRAGRLLALRTGSGRLVYPLWQFRDGAPLPGLAEVLGTAGYDPERPTTGWTIASWLSTEDPDLGGLPREFLAAGRLDEVLDAAIDLSTEFGMDEKPRESNEVPPQPAPDTLKQDDEELERALSEGISRLEGRDREFAERRVLRGQTSEVIMREMHIPSARLYKHLEKTLLEHLVEILRVPAAVAVPKPEAAA